MTQIITHYHKNTAAEGGTCNSYQFFFQTDVIVNSVSADLMLNNGAISQAIQLAAGPQLQQLVTANNSQASFGDIIETEGCQLQCKQVFHAVAVGQGINEQVNRSNFT